MHANLRKVLLAATMMCAASSAADAAANTDIIVTATSSSQPVLMNAWLTSGTHVNAMGANAASRRDPMN